ARVAALRDGRSAGRIPRERGESRPQAVAWSDAGRKAARPAAWLRGVEARARARRSRAQSGRPRHGVLSLALVNRPAYAGDAATRRGARARARRTHDAETRAHRAAARTHRARRPYRRGPIFSAWYGVSRAFPRPTG